MQGEGPRLVEQADIVRLGLHEIGGLERFYEGSEVGPCCRRQKRLPVDDGGHLLQAVDDLPLGIDQKRGQDLERQHGIISISYSLSGASRRSFGPLAAGNPGIPAEPAEFAVPLAAERTEAEAAGAALVVEIG